MSHDARPPTSGSADRGDRGSEAASAAASGSAAKSASRAPAGGAADATAPGSGDGDGRRPLPAPVAGLLRLAGRLGFGRDWELVPAAVIIGLVMSGVTMAFILPLHWIEERAAHADPASLWWMVLLLPAAGGLICGLVPRILPARDEAPGVSVEKIIWSIHRRQARVPVAIGLRKWLSATATIGSGGSAGAEGPIVIIGSSIGSGIGRTLGAERKSTATLLGCGAAAGIASVFNAPIAGVFFTMEILLRDFSLRTFTPIVIAAVISAAGTQGVLGNEALFDSGADLVADAFTWHEIPNYLLLGLVCGSAAPLFIRALFATIGMVERIRLPQLLKPALGGLVVGVLGLVWLLARPGGPEAPGHGLPGFMGNGYPVIRDLLDPAFYAGGASPGAAGHAAGHAADVAASVDGTPAPGNGTPASGDAAPASGDAAPAPGADARLPAPPALLAVLVLLAVVKGLATCVTIGSGGSGGVFAPALFLGASIGGVLGAVVNAVGLFPAASPAHYALVGMAAMVAATMHAPLTAMLMVYEITRTYEVILPLMLAAVIATIVGRLWYAESVYSVIPSRLGLKLGSMSDLTIMRRMRVDDVPLVAPVYVHPEESADRLLELSERLSVSDFVVTDARDRYLGLVTQNDLKEALVYREAIPLLQVHELMRDDLPVVHPDDTLDVAIDKFSRTESGALVVLHEPGSRSVRGLLSRSRLMRAYHDALEGDG